MNWSQRQVDMLASMGIKLWQAPPKERQALPQSVAAPAPAPARVQVQRSPLMATADDEMLAVLEAPRQPPVSAPITAKQCDTAHLDWPALREAVQECRACALCETRTQTVFGIGNTSAQWMIVGEAPGEQEDLRGEPFVGPAGQLLDNMLAALGLTRQEAGSDKQVFIANTLKCRPPSNRNPQPDELAQCEPYLQRQIALVRPRIILAMGRFAVQALLQTDEPIGRLRGRVHQYQGVPLVVTYHPAYLLRNLADKSRAWQDLRLARTVLIGAGRGT